MGYSLTLFNHLRITYPLDPSIIVSFKSSGRATHFTLPPLFLKASFCIGGFYLVSLAARLLYRSFTWFYRFLKTRVSPNRALKDQPDKVLGSPKKYAVIYGAANQIGSAFARYFAIRGYNLVIIDES